MSIEYLTLNPTTLMPDAAGQLYRKSTEDSGSVSIEATNQYKIKLSANKPKITANGVDTATITAMVHNYLDQPQTNFSGNIKFTLNDVEQIAAAVAGVATITFNSAVVGTFRFGVIGVGDFNMSEIEVTAS